MYKDDKNILFIGEYQPYRICGEKNPKFNKYTGGYILDLKDNKECGINYYTIKVTDEFKKLKNIDKADIITAVPSSTKNFIRDGMVTLLKNLSENFDNLTYLKCLNRKETICKKANGGLRSEDLEYKTIEVMNSKLFKDKVILLFDDVTTTGTSLLTCKKILKENGAKAVNCIALGKTV